MINIVLYQPEIPGNTGNIMRTCVATDTKLHLIKPLGFSLEEIAESIKDNGYDYLSNNELGLSKVILHSDQGVQFTSWDFVNFCKDNNVTQSMSKAGCLYDNAPMEARYS